MLRPAEVAPGDRVLELGAGVEAVAFPAARERSANVLAVEIEPRRCLLLRARRAAGPVADRVEVVRKNMFGGDLSHATVVSGFVGPGAMVRLRPKLERELAPGTRVVSRCPVIPGRVPVAHDLAADVILKI
jgi:16S rRNA A1518/A1519 N6-dimethyltransferase RsmA/KsgA/DIM1 with predicted DNA glycosylase/AP lyase activity